MNQGNAVFDLIVANRTENEKKEIFKALNQSTSLNSEEGDSIPLFFALFDLKLAKKFVEYGSNPKRINFSRCVSNHDLERPGVQFLIDNQVNIDEK